MGVEPQASERLSGAAATRSRPKPRSLQRRFIVMQSGAVAGALLLLASSLFLNHIIQSELTSPMERLNATFITSTRVHKAIENTLASFWSAYQKRDPALRAAYETNARHLSKLIDEYPRLTLATGEAEEAGSLRHRMDRFLALTAELLNGSRKLPPGSPEMEQVKIASADVRAGIGRVMSVQLANLRGYEKSLDLYSQGLAFLLVLCAIFAILAMVSFRYVHREHLWGPLEDLRQLVVQVRKGNLDVSAKVPNNIELGSLVRAFLEMAAELREMRDGLEQKVRERTAELEETQEDLLQAAKLSSLGQLVSGVAHEINNPLTSVLGFSEIVLARPGLDPAVRAQVRTIREESLRLKNLIANLTSFARRAPHRTQRMDLRSVVRRLVELRQYQLTANNIELHVDSCPRPVWVKGDPDQLLQVVLNLVLNAEQAVKSCRERGGIWLRCGFQDSMAELSVRDDGPGIAPEVRDHLFEPFFTTKPVGQGTGLGLSISHGIVKQHGGELTVESGVRAGTTMNVRLPLAPEEPCGTAAAEETAGKLPAARAAKHQVLAIDDEPGILEMMGEALLRLDCETTPVRNSNDVEPALENSRFDLVICDLKMPGKNGLEILRLVRSKRPELARRFLLVTGNLADADRHEADLVGVPILPKPFSVSRLREAVRELLRRQF